MTRMTLRLRLLLSLLGAFAIAAPIEAVEQPAAPSSEAVRPAIVVDVDAENPPFMSSRAGDAVGLYPALIRAALGRCHDHVRVQAKPWKRAFVEIDKAQAGVGGLCRNAERLAKYDFSDPIYVENIAVFYRTVQPFDFRTVADLYGKRVGVLRGWSYGDDFDVAKRNGSIATEEVSSDRSNFLKLTDGRLDAVLAIEESGQAAMAASGLHGIEQANAYLASYPVYLAFSKKAAKSDLLVCFNKALAEMKQDGAFERIVRQELGR